MNAKASVASLLLLSLLAINMAALSGCKGKHATIRTPSSSLGETVATGNPALSPAVTEAGVPNGGPGGDSAENAQWLIQPGKNVGGITGKSTLADLQALFGKANVKPGQVPGAEGSQLDGAWVYPNDLHKKLMVIWKEGVTPKTVESVSVIGTQSVWHTPEGVRLGTTLKALERLNGVPFTLTGFDWDYGGSVLSWGDQGKLRAKYQQNGALLVRLTYPPHSPDAVLQKVMGDQTFSSANPAMQTINPVVNSLWVSVQ